jgi:hypothetical protein
MKRPLAWLIAGAVLLGVGPLLAAVILRQHHTSFLLGMDSESTPLVLAWTTAWATMVLAAIAGWALLENHRLIQATEQQAEASQRQAAASIDIVEATRLDRELAWRPNLLAGPIGVTTTDNTRARCHIDNAGPGPALLCRIMYLFGDSTPVVVENGALLHLPPGQGVDIPLDRREQSHWYGFVSLDLPQDFLLTDDEPLLYCEDQLGHVHLFKGAKVKRWSPPKASARPGRATVRGQIDRRVSAIRPSLLTAPPCNLLKRREFVLSVVPRRAGT